MQKLFLLILTAFFLGACKTEHKYHYAIKDFRTELQPILTGIVSKNFVPTNDSLLAALAIPFNIFTHMPTILLTTTINAPIERCFDLSRNIDLHTISTAKTNERAIGGRTSGLINLHETVTWQATHFGVRQQLSSIITAFERPYYFRDEQLKGIFKSIYHEHRFEQAGNNVIMTDHFEFQSPFGFLGRIFNQLILTQYLTRLLEHRNQVIKQYAESELWRNLLPET
jgi:ligand-binding SRPBCC domain-containing protein